MRSRVGRSADRVEPLIFGSEEGLPLPIMREVSKPLTIIKKPYILWM